MICAVSPAYPHFKGLASAGDAFHDDDGHHDDDDEHKGYDIDDDGDYDDDHDDVVDISLTLIIIMTTLGESQWSLQTMRETCERPSTSSPGFPRPWSS